MIKINLLKQEKKEFKEAPVAPVKERGERRRVQLRFNYNLILIVALVIIAVMFFKVRTDLAKETELLDLAKQERRELQDVRQKVRQLQAQKEFFERKIDLINELKAQQGSAVRIMEEVSRHIPDWVWLTQANYQAKVVRLKGRAMNNTLIAAYISNLESSPYFRNVNIVSSLKRRAGNTQFHEFTLNMRYINPEAQKAAEKKESEKEQ